MRPLTLLATALATNAVVRAQDNTPTHGVDENDNVFLPNGYASLMPGHDTYMGFHKRLASMLNDKNVVERGTGQGLAPYSTQRGMCMDVQNQRLQGGSRVQLWQCSGGANQAWRVEGPLFQTNNDMCLDVPWGNAYDGAPLQVWKCDGQNPNQKFSQIGSTLHWQGANGKYCVDVTHGMFNNGVLLQLWTCYPGSANQAFVLGSAQAQGNAPPSSPATTGATNFYGYNCISLDDFVRKYPTCAPYKGALQAAGADQGINPTFLGAIAMVESNCAEGLKNSPNAKYGPFQFMYEPSWTFYGGSNRDKTNFWDAAFGSARYWKALLQQTNNNLFNSMRLYNGQVKDGGDPDYQAHAAAYMGGYA